MTVTFPIGSRLVGGDHPVFVTAEIGVNHNGDLSLAKEMVDSAKAAGCDCAKFQTFTAETFCSDYGKTFKYCSQGEEVIENEYAMFKRLELSRDEWAELMDRCRARNIIFMTTVQDPENLDMMLELGLEAIKVGSDDFDHLENLELFANTGLPLIISKGMADAPEVERTLRTLTPLTDKLCVLHCVSLYPSGPEHLNLQQIPVLMEAYPDVVWGFSDHSQGTTAAVGAVTLGAQIIEKHFTLNCDLPGPDHWFSADPDEMTRLVDDIRFAQVALGSAEIRPSAEENTMRSVMRRRVVAARNLSAGEPLSRADVAFKRSGTGAELAHWTEMEGACLERDIRKDEGILTADIRGDGR